MEVLGEGLQHISKPKHDHVAGFIRCGLTFGPLFSRLESSNENERHGLFTYLFIHIYMNIYIERERKREGGGTHVVHSDAVPQKTLRILDGFLRLSQTRLPLLLPFPVKEYPLYKKQPTPLDPPRTLRKGLR